MVLKYVFHSFVRLAHPEVLMFSSRLLHMVSEAHKKTMGSGRGGYCSRLLSTVHLNIWRRPRRSFSTRLPGLSSRARSATGEAMTSRGYFGTLVESGWAAWNLWNLSRRPIVDSHGLAGETEYGMLHCTAKKDEAAHDLSLFQP